MKKILLIGVFIVLLILFGFKKYAMRYPEYQIYQTYSFQSPDGIDQVATVIVYKNWQDEEIVNRIEEFFINTNGQPDSLELRLFRESERDVPYKTKYFEYTKARQ